MHLRTPTARPPRMMLMHTMASLRKPYTLDSKCEFPDAPAPARQLPGRRP